MAHQIVATSVPRGLDGVSGYQTVLKSKGIPPRLFDRLKTRAGYSHPYSHGDPRNPVVYLHRIEELAGHRWHVLGCIRDAGSDHTGRSNFLAHMLGIEAGEARSKPGGPAAAAMAGGCFLTKWDGPPDGTALSKTLVAADVPPLAGDLPAWKAAGLDPGLAGDLAAAAMGNRKVVLVTRPTDDVLALFADALRLVEPSKRWGVTFNTCAVEDFDGTWKAVRNDLVDTKQLSAGRAAVIDLTAGERGSEDPFAQFARGETSSLPWQKQSRAVAAPPEGIPERSQVDSTGPSRGGADPGGAGDATRKPQPGGSSRDRQRVRRPLYAEEDVPSPVPWQHITIAALLIVIGGAGAAILFREQLFGTTTPARPQVSALDRQLAAELDLPSVVKPAPPALGDGSTLPAQGGAIVSQQEASNQLAEKRAEIAEQLKNGAYGTVRTQVSELRKKVAGLKVTYAKEWATLVTSDGKHPDPNSAFDQILQAFDELDDVASDVDKVLGSRILAPLDELSEHQATLAAADEKLAVAAASLDELQTQVRDLEADLRERKTENQQGKAFKDFQTLAKAVSLPARGWQQLADTGGPLSAASESKEIDLGPFQFADLIDPQVRLAVPRDLDEGDSIKLVNVNDAASAVWEIQYLKGAVGLDNNPQPPRVLASLSVNDGRLILKPEKLEQGLGSLLRRCVLLIEACPPDSPDSEPARQIIQLSEPTRARPVPIDLFATKRHLERLETPPGLKRGVTRHDRQGKSTHKEYALPPRSVFFSAVVWRDAMPTDKVVTFRLEGDREHLDDSGVGKDLSLLRFKSESNPTLDLQLIVNVNLSLADSTLGVSTAFGGADSSFFDIGRVGKEFVEDPKAGLSRIRTHCDLQVNEIKNTTLAVAQTPAGSDKIYAWFSAVNIGNSLLKPMVGHETRRKSFELFLKHRYEEARETEQGRRDVSRLSVDFPQTLDEFAQRCAQATNEAVWQAKFAQRVGEWNGWFWPKFEDYWLDVGNMFQKAAAERYELRIQKFVSLAYDESGEEYEVPLVVLDESAAPVDGPASSGGGTPVGLD